MHGIDLKSKYEISEQKTLRTLVVYSYLYLAGTALQFTNKLSLHSLGAGLILPGGGFFYQANVVSTGWLWLLGIVALCHFGYTVFLWFATGNVFAPMFSWLASAVAATLLCDSQLNSICFGKQPNLVIFVWGLAIPILWWLAQKALRHFSTKNAIYPLPLNQPLKQQQELNTEDLPHLRFLLDRALQPIHKFNGFEWIDQFQTSAVRYQLNFFGYALALCQAQHLPAMRGYMAQAQENLLLKLQDYRVWQYWQYEAKWGKLKSQLSPANLDNIMFTGFAAAQISLFQQTIKSARLTNTPLVFNHPESGSDVADLGKLVSLLQRSMQKSDYFLAACEPNWVYPLCNLISAIAIKIHQPAWWQAHEKQFLNALAQEFIRHDGSFIACRSHLTGWALPNIGGVLPQALTCFFLNALDQPLAQKQWLILRDKLVKDNRLNRRQFWPIDTGNYGLSRAAAYAGTALAAREFGDDEVATLCLTQLEQEYPSTLLHSVAHRAQVSVWAHALAFMGCTHQTNALHQLVHQPTRPLHPIVDEVPYPQVQALLARYEEEQLKIKLYTEQNNIYTIRLAQLKPLTRYQYQGQSMGSFYSDANGNANLALLINHTTSYQIYQG